MSSNTIGEVFALVFVALLLFTIKATGHEVEEGTGVLCDTQAQIERYAALGVTSEAEQIINAEAKQKVCALVEVRYIRGMVLNTFHLSIGVVQAVEILVLAVKIGVWGEIPPELQYTLFLIEEGDPV